MIMNTEFWIGNSPIEGFIIGVSLTLISIIILTICFYFKDIHKKENSKSITVSTQEKNATICQKRFQKDMTRNQFDVFF